MLNLWIFGAFLLGYALSAVTSMGGPVSLALARRRGFWVGWEAHKKNPNALSMTHAQVNRLLAEDDARLDSL